MQASVGHIRDLPKSNIGVDEANDFAPEYEIIKARKRSCSPRRGLRVDTVFLAPDPDREGSIAWHVAELLKDKNRTSSVSSSTEITSRAVHEALDHPRDLNVNLFDAQQAAACSTASWDTKISLLWKKRQTRHLRRTRPVRGPAPHRQAPRRAARLVPEEYWLFSRRS